MLKGTLKCHTLTGFCFAFVSKILTTATRRTVFGKVIGKRELCKSIKMAFVTQRQTEKKKETQPQKSVGDTTSTEEPTLSALFYKTFSIFSDLHNNHQLFRSQFDNRDMTLATKANHNFMTRNSKEHRYTQKRRFTTVTVISAT